jgi:hypothetical protein
MRWTASLACCGLLLMLAAACGPPTPTAFNLSSSPGPTSSPGAISSNPSGVGASPTPDGTRLPLPAGMPVYPGAEPLEPAAAGWAIAAWSTKGDPPAVYDYYVAELPRSGFEVTGALPGGDAAVIRFATADGVAYQLDLTGHAPVLISLGAPHD